MSRDTYHIDLKDDDALAQAIALSLETTDHLGTAPPPSSNAQEQVEGASGATHSQLYAPSELLPPSELSSFHSEKGWRPNAEHLQLIMSMDISENAATRALYYTGNTSPEEALEWVCENLENPELHQPFVPPCAARPSPSPSGPLRWVRLDDALLLGESPSSFKMAFVVNAELKMGCGKTAAQVGHAAVGLYSVLTSRADMRDQVSAWEGECGSKKIVLKGQSASHLSELAEKAESLGIPTMAIRDAGRTQVEPGALTVIALFGRGVDVDGVTGHLKLM